VRSLSIHQVCQGTRQRESEQDHCQKRTSLSYVTGHWYIILTFSTESTYELLDPQGAILKPLTP
ncbi:hypothetical protein CY34DRAFT_807813, partial [Suillus luteus UH-Slu-Lm8-n1]